MKPPYQVSFSGGRTSAYMTYRLLKECSDQYEFIVTFANTGLEHEKTLEFVRNCDTHFGFRTVWLEAVVHHTERKSSGHKVVSFETASRKGEPFEEYIRKYGIPNTSFPSCTRELKLNPMHSYLASLGIHHREVPTAIGIRVDETRRVNKANAAEMNLRYPLIDPWPTTKEEILDWWEDQPFDLGIEEFEGNCKGCFKKSLRKQFLQIEKDPSAFDFHRRMEAEHRYTGPQDGPRVFFRGNMDTNALFELHSRNAGNIRRQKTFDWESGGCSESCEVYDMETNT